MALHDNTVLLRDRDTAVLGGCMARILVDMVHPADVNFYKNALSRLREGNEILITVLERGDLLSFARAEYPGFNIVPLGKHRRGKLGKLFGLILRELGFVSLFIKQKFDIVTSFGFYPAIAAKLFFTRSVLFYDDYEHKSNFALCRMFADKLVIPASVPYRSRKTVTYNGYKELAYLKGFKDGSRKGKHVFVRDVAPISLNYKDLKRTDFTSAFRELKKRGYKIYYYPEEGYSGEYGGMVELVKPPFPGFYETIAGARAVITSGDTIAREAALLGVPAIYTGGRVMSVNSSLEKEGLIIPSQDVLTAFDSLESPEHYRKKAKAVVSGLEDTTEVILRELL
ncbi:MAG: hypothetical protein HGA85_04540 [Nanoarchaeota archaeon]|nr:hypothetical protein [Nanoarchaeota archaeon]